MRLVQEVDSTLSSLTGSGECVPLWIYWLRLTTPIPYYWLGLTAPIPSYWFRLTPPMSSHWSGMGQETMTGNDLIGQTLGQRIQYSVTIGQTC